MKLGQMLSFVVDGLPPEAQRVAGPAPGQRAADVPRAGRRRGARRARRRCRPSCSPAGTRCRWPPPRSARCTGPRWPTGRAGGREGPVPRASTTPSAATWPTPAGWARCCRLGDAAQRRRRRAGRRAASTAWPTSSTTASRRPTSRHFADRYRGHPVPRRARRGGRALVPAGAHQHLGRRHDLRPSCWPRPTQATRDRAGEAIFRFAQSSILRERLLQRRSASRATTASTPAGGSPRSTSGWSSGSTPTSSTGSCPCSTRCSTHDEQAHHRRHGAAPASWPPTTGSTPARVFACVSAPYRGLLRRRSSPSRPSYTSDALRSLLDVRGPYADVLTALDMPPSFVLLDRVVWGVSAVLGRLGATGRWRGSSGVPARRRAGHADGRRRGGLVRR